MRQEWLNLIFRTQKCSFTGHDSRRSCVFQAIINLKFRAESSKGMQPFPVDFKKRRAQGLPPKQSTSCYGLSKGEKYHAPTQGGARESLQFLQ